MQKKGFTLAEVLITLGIIGVVATLTIPTLIGTYQKQQTVTQYKKAYSEISQALKMAEADNGPMETWDTTDQIVGTTNDLGTEHFAQTFLYPYLKTTKTCHPSTTECWTPAISLSNTAGYLKNGNAGDFSATAVSGYSIYFWASGSKTHAQFWIDVDGPRKGKSKLGVDIFGMIARVQGNATTKAGIYAVGLDRVVPLTRDELINEALYGCSKSINVNTSGRDCSGLIQMDGWRIADDYPWN